jgi:rhodanese-related sulfurtransferase
MLTTQAVDGSGAGSVDPAVVKAWLDAGECVLVDVRERDEHAREHINGGQLIPLGGFNPSALPQGSRVVLHCKSGVRSRDAAARCGGCDVYTLKGGIEGWKQAGLPTVVDADAPRMGILRQVQVAVGAAVVVGCALAYWVDPRLGLLAAIPGAGLLMAGLTGLCPLAELIAKLPWNAGFQVACQAKGR